MMKNRIISACLACLMLLSLLPMAAFAVPVYEEGSIKHASKFEENRPTNIPGSVKKGEKEDVVYPGPWDYVSYASESALKAGTVNVIADFVDTGEGWLIPKDEGTPPGGVSTGYVYWESSTTHGASTSYWCNGGMGFANSGRIMGTRYTAECSGLVDLSFTTLGNWQSGSNVATVSYAILVDGEQVWPAVAEGQTPAWYSLTYGGTGNGAASYGVNYAAEVNELIPTGIPVEVGQTVEFLVMAGSGFQGCYTSRGNYVEGAVTYTALLDAPKVEGLEVDMTKDMDCYIGVYLDSETSREGAKVGANYWLSDADDFDLDSATPLELVRTNDNWTTFCYDGFTVKQMTDKIWVQPYTTVDGDSEIHYGAVVEMSIADAIAKGYADEEDATLKAALRAFVNLGANAQYAFAYNDSDLANAFLDDDEQNPSENFGNDVWAQSNDGTTGVKITLASLVLDNQIGMKFVAPKVDGVSEYKLQVSKKADFSDAVTVDMTETEDGLGYRGIYYVNFAELSDTFYIRVASGNAYGDTLTYSVESYVSRISMEPIGDDEYLLAAAIYDFAVAVAALEE